MGFLNYMVGVEGPEQVVGDLGTWKLETLDHFHFIPNDVDRDMSSTTFLEVNDYLLRFTDIEGEIIVIASVYQILYLFPVLRLIIV